jgi:hypothetical protein
MVKKIIGYILAFFGGALAFIFGSNLIRGRISDDNDSVGKIGSSIGKSKDINRESGKVTGDIKRDNKDARGGIRTALDILKGIEKTDPPSEG